MGQLNKWECPLCFGEGEHGERCPAKHLTQAPAAPVVHLNGTGWKDLSEHMETAMHAIRDAEKALCYAAPTGRDYYVQPAGTMARAQDEHFARLLKLRAVSAELEIIWSAIADQEPKPGKCTEVKCSWHRQ